MSVLEDLTEEELYLYALLQDEAGLDQAEFSWTDMDNDDMCWRAWAFQWSWWRNPHHKQIDQCARSVGKSLSIKARAFAFPFIHSGGEMVITAPEGVHLDAITDVVETSYANTRLGREMLLKGRTGVKHRPFHMNFQNGARIMGRIPQRDGKGVKGIHPIWLEMDEAQDYPDKGWVELLETLKRGFEGARWRAHGVTRGVRDYFYKFTQNDSGWSINRKTAMHRPTWTDEERQDKIQEYGSRDHPDYRRNVLGLHGDATNPLFVLHRLMACCDDNLEEPYNNHEYTKLRITNELVLEMDDDILPLLDFPASHLNYTTTWIGMDVGYCLSDDHEILTQRGWLVAEDLREGDWCLGINPDTKKSEWQLVSGVYREHFDSIPMVSIDGQSFSTLATPHHKWFVKSESGDWRWKQTRTLNTKDCIPLTVPRGDLPIVSSYDDDFVELVAWYWTEGSYKDGSVTLSQSYLKHPEYVDRIDGLLNRLYGGGGPLLFGPQKDEAKRSHSYQWSRRERTDGINEGMVYYHLPAHTAKDLLECVLGKEKIVSFDFLRSLTMVQLDLFIETSVDADGWRTQSGARKIEQHSEGRIKSFEYACALAGYATSTNYDSDRSRYHLSILKSDTVRPIKAAQFPRETAQAMSVDMVDYSGWIWCPTVTHGNWLARRNGSVYYTGNTNDPSEILVFAEVVDKKVNKDATILKLVARIQLERINNPNQVAAIMWLIDFYKPKAFAMDKMQPVSEPVLTPDGWVPIGQLSVGDYVVGSDGKRTLVTGVFPQVDKRVVELEFSDGANTRCGPEHLWTAEVRRRGRVYAGGNTFTAEQLKLLKQEGWSVSIPLVKPIEGCESALPVPPYVLGALLGDGNIRSDSIRFSSVDDEILTRVERELPDGHVLKFVDRCDYSLTGPDDPVRSDNGRFVGGSNEVLESLRGTGLAGKLAHEKFIPDAYLEGSVEQRVDLLRGLMDTDGYSDDSGHVGFCTSSEELIDGIRTLVWGLGGTASKRRNAVFVNGSQFRDQFKSTINLPVEINPFFLNRKAVNAGKRIPKRWLREVRQVDEEQSVCIRVEASDHLYVTKDFVVTHNTGVGLPLFQDIQAAAEANPNLRMFVDAIKGYNFSEKILVDFDSTIEVDEFRGDAVKEAGLYRNVLEYSSDKLRWLVDTKRLRLPWDTELIGEYQGQTYTYDKSVMDMYGRRKVFSKGNFHALDASRMAALGWAQHSIEAVTKEESWEPVRSILL